MQIPPTKSPRWTYQRRKKVVFDLLKNPLFETHLTQELSLSETPAFFDQLRTGDATRNSQLATRNPQPATHLLQPRIHIPRTIIGRIAFKNSPHIFRRQPLFTIKNLRFSKRPIVFIST